eukprot:Skav207272  [mRNA]  locus=scaffold434:56301:57859:- [translate_table: standard]
MATAALFRVHRPAATAGTSRDRNKQERLDERLERMGVPDVSEATASAAQSAAAQMQETLAHALEKSSDMQVCDTVGAILVAICCVLALAARRAPKTNCLTMLDRR